MRQGSLALLFVLSVASPLVNADESAIDPPPERQQVEPEGRRFDNELTPEAPDDSLSTAITDAERAQLAHLRQENHQLRMQLQQAPSKAQPQLLSDQQQWFAVGGGVGVLGFLLGVLATRGRRRRQWLN
ncbi:hypothetical protein CH92_12485 [Stutzerimonas stutzeri]|uniref:Translation initiation factor 2 (IF-2, GTPase) n=1 Tax=Stutzerimonas stutzeri TaxID=316 RepID=W8RBM6_STUST|nr:hypothetical protein [Stutzerimonas stutzeri]AHL75867.1 hypothetical protein CH92_12485 [Stutzerimonas stutzeri]MCQ4331235.1 hypothetical protein [Stutzerimonas stutzeri]